MHRADICSEFPQADLSKVSNGSERTFRTAPETAANESATELRAGTFAETYMQANLTPCSDQCMFMWAGKNKVRAGKKYSR